MKHTKNKKILILLLLIAFILVLFNSDITYAAINEQYYAANVVDDVHLEEAFSGSSLLDLLAKLIYAVGRFLEWILGDIFKLLTKTSDFPWADRIVFNSVPLLDVNFINPHSSSFLGNQNISSLIKNLYATILTLAVSFFGIMVMVTSIKLVISTIASEKAKYKQAIVDWVIGFVMLFCMHYFISFVFYLNEQLVEVASSIVSSQLSKANANIANVQASNQGQKIIDEAKSRKVVYRGVNADKIFSDNVHILTAWMNLPNGKSQHGIHRALFNEESVFLGFGESSDVEIAEQLRLAAMMISWAQNSSITVDQIKEYQTKYRLKDSSSNSLVWVKGDSQLCQGLPYFVARQIFGGYCDEITAAIKTVESVRAGYATATGAFTPGYPDSYYDKGYIIDNYLLSNYDDAWHENVYDPVEDLNFYWSDVLKDLITLKSASSSNKGSIPTLLPNLATYFRYNAYSKEAGKANVTGLQDTDNVNIQNMIMYSILVAQSMILFIAYIKRLFYIMILALMAPVVVVFDFFQKFGK